MTYQRFELPNGIRVIHRRIKSPVAHFGIIINTGARDEHSEEHGLAHFIEHTIFKGTRKRKAFHILSRLDNVGADMNAFTTKEETCLYATFLKEHLGRTAELFADITLNSIFPEKEINKEKDVIIDEINSYKDDPAEAIFDEIEEKVFAGHALGHNILGTIERVESFRRKNIFRFIKRTYNTDQMVVCSVGDFPFSKIVRTVEKHYGAIPAIPRTFTREQAREQQHGYFVENKGIHQAHCIMGVKAYGRTEKKRLPLFLLNNILGGPALNSRLNLNIRERHGFCYNLESNYTVYSDTGLLTIYMGTDFDYLDKTIKLVHKELKKLRSQKLGSMQLHIAKEQIKGQIAIANENPVNELISMGKSIISYDNVEELDELYAKINAIEAGDLLEVANEVLREEQLTTLIYKKN